MRKTIIALLIGSALLAGCSTVHVSDSAARPVTYDLIYDHALTSENPNSGHIVVVRDSGFLGSGCTFDVILDTTKVAALKYPSTEVDIYTAPGNHILTVSNISATCPNHRAAVNLSIQSGQKLIYDISMFSEGAMDLVPAVD